MPIPPSTVSPGQPITSAWGNDVVATLYDIQAAYQADVADINNRLATRIRGGYSSVTTNNDGYVTIPFGITFENPPLIVAMLTMDNPAIGQPYVMMVQTGGVTTTAFTARVYISSGAPVISAPVNINWIATIGWI